MYLETIIDTSELPEKDINREFIKLVKQCVCPSCGHMLTTDVDGDITLYDCCHCDFELSLDEQDNWVIAF